MNGWKWRHWGIVLALLAGIEILVLSIRFSADPLADASPIWAKALSYAPSLLMAVLAAVAALGLILGPRLSTYLQILAQGHEDRRWAPVRWLGLHLFLLLGFVLLSPLVLERVEDAAEIVVLVWLLLGIGVAFTCLLVLAPAGNWWNLLREEWQGVLLASMMGTLAWLVGSWIWSFWDLLIQATFEFSRLLLKLYYPVVESLPDQRILGVGGFRVVVAEQCSGSEGMALVGVFLTIYFIKFRRELLMRRALVLIPLGILLIWMFNALRLAILVSIGSSWSREIAVGGFHSQIGWIGFILVSLGMILVSHRSGIFSRGQSVTNLNQGTLTRKLVSEGEMATALLLPWLVLMALVIGSAALMPEVDWLYPVRVVAVAIVLWRFRNIYQRWIWNWSWPAVGLGSLTYVMWMVLIPPSEVAMADLGGALSELPPWLAWSWIVFRVIGSVVTVPIAEELAFRGYLLSKFVNPMLGETPSAKFHWLSFLGSSFAFGLLHSSWIAGTLAGMAYGVAFYYRQRILDAVTAHITTNFLIAMTVLVDKQWSLLA